MPRGRDAPVHLPVTKRIKDGRIFEISRRHKNVIYLRCQTNHCRGTAKKIGNADIISVHDHSSICFEDRWCQLKANFKDALKSALERHYWKLRVLYDTIAELYPREIKIQLPYNTILSSLKRWRNAIYPPNPASLTEMAIYLDRPESGRLLEYDVGRLVSRRIIDSQGNYHLLLCDTQFVESTFRNVSRIFIDATFQTTPRVQGVYQLLTILGVAYGHAIPFVHVLMSAKSEIAYTSVLEEVKNLIQNASVEIVMTDFEQALRNASKKIFTRAHVTGCNVHYDRALLQKIKKSGLNNLVKENEQAKMFVRKIMALAFLPAELISQEYERLKGALLPAEARSFASFCAYYERQWLRIVTPAGFSVYGLSRRTNNVTESYNSVLADQLGKHPTPWLFIVKLCKLTSNARDDVQSLRLFKRIRRHPRYATKYKQKELDTAWTQLYLGDISAEQFLDRTAMLKGHIRQRLQRLDDIPEGTEGEEPEMVETPHSIDAVEDPDFDREIFEALGVNFLHVPEQDNNDPNALEGDVQSVDGDALGSDSSVTSAVDHVEDPDTNRAEALDFNDDHISVQDNDRPNSVRGEAATVDRDALRSDSSTTSAVENDEIQNDEVDTVEVSDGWRRNSGSQNKYREFLRWMQDIPNEEPTIDDHVDREILVIEDNEIIDLTEQDDSDVEEMEPDEVHIIEPEEFVENNGGEMGRGDEQLLNENEVDNEGHSTNEPIANNNEEVRVSRSRKKNLRKQRMRKRKGQNINADSTGNGPRGVGENKRGRKRRRTKEKAKLALQCKICLLVNKSHIFLPCGHHCACERCSTILFKKCNPTCPICRDPIVEVRRVFTG